MQNNCNNLKQNCGCDAPNPCENNFPISRPFPTIIINRGPTGPTGATGPAGEDGVTPTFTIGTVTTLEPEEEATVTLTGTAPDYVLNFGIPRGATGTAQIAQTNDVK